MDGPQHGAGEKNFLIAKELQLEISSRGRALYFHGESMRPFLIEGDEVVVEPVAWDEIRIGDVITYRYLDRFPTRRVVHKTAEQLDLWCENWPTRFFPAPRVDVLGRATARRRGEVWLGAADREWRVARWVALARYARLVLAPAAWLRLRGFAGKLLRSVGLRRPGRV